MRLVRRLIVTHRGTTATIIVAALALRLLLPATFMLSTIDGRLVVSVCTGAMSAPSDVVVIDMRAFGHGAGEQDRSRGDGKPELTCSFAVSSGAVLGSVDPTLAMNALALVALVALFSRRWPEVRPALHQRPPSRGPPVVH